VQIISGKIHLPEKQLTNELKSVALIQKMTDTGVIMSLIFQYHALEQGIQCVFFSNENPQVLIEDNSQL
jgi:hypothetical protein